MMPLKVDGICKCMYLLRDRFSVPLGIEKNISAEVHFCKLVWEILLSVGQCSVKVGSLLGL